MAGHCPAGRQAAQITADRRPPHRNNGAGELSETGGTRPVTTDNNYHTQPVSLPVQLSAGGIFMFIFMCPLQNITYNTPLERREVVELVGPPRNLGQL